ncbi:hypothetical protein B4U80_11676 [Leptotrombidium deliense]|uniref:HTH CENPB-type domain-containing protein n=1 Tax=Leptotrombidium deliense TaxID=299467 RepID=A0A443STY4_9ACAR|nr:hypothetical protein B4U80_11676 [Leptotrombidium deliense]
MESVTNGCIENQETNESDTKCQSMAIMSDCVGSVTPKTSASPRRRKELTLEEKIQVIEESCEKGNSQRILAKKYEVSKTQIHRILTHKQDLLRLYNDCKNGGLTVYNPHGIYLSPVSKRLSGYNSEFDDINAETWEWYRDMKDQKMEITGPMIKRKAREIAQRLGKDEKFKGSNGWLEKIKKRFETHYSHWEQVKRQQEEYKVEPVVSLEEETASDLALVPVVTQLETDTDETENNDDIINLDTAIYYTKKLRQFAEVNNYHVLLSVFTFAEQSLEKGENGAGYQADYSNSAKNH